MADAGDDLRALRARAAALEAEARRRPDPEDPGTHALAATIFNAGSMPTALPGRFALHPARVSGNQAERASVTVAARTGSLFGTVLGSQIPAAGETLVFRQIDGHWVAERGKAAGGGGANPCKCTWPKALSYRGTVGQVQAGFYFVNAAATQPEPVYTLTYGARPAEIPKELQLYFFAAPGGVHDPWYITMPDNAWFSPPIPGFLFGTPTHIYFYLWMQICQANVMVIDAPYGTGTAPGNTKGAGNNVLVYAQTACTPQFQMKLNFAQTFASIFGTHGSDDIVPGSTGGLGMYTNPRVGL